MNGHCLCGAVSFVSPQAREIGACHCGYCRRWGGGPMLTVHCGPDVKFEGGENIGTYASSEWAERAFCRQCGTHLYYRLHATDRKSTRLNSSHLVISYAVFCLKKKKIHL